MQVALIICCLYEGCNLGEQSLHAKFNLEFRPDGVVRAISHMCD